MVDTDKATPALTRLISALTRKGESWLCGPDRGPFMIRKKHPARCISLVRSLLGAEPGVFCIANAKQSTFYVFKEIPCAIGGRGFVVHRLGLGTLYHVRIGQPIDCTCECMGFLAHSSCKHILGLLALEKHGLV